MKIMIVTNDPVQGTELADALKSSGHLTVRAWSAGEALLLARNDVPTLAVIDRCHGDDPEALKLAGYLADMSVDVLWLGDATNALTRTTNALVAMLAPPCDPESVGCAVNTLLQRRAGLTETQAPLARLTILVR